MLPDLVANLKKVAERLLPRGKRQVPAHLMRDCRRVVELIPVLEHRSMPQRLSERPTFLKPGDVSNLPEQWVDDLQPRAEELLVREILHECEGVPARIPDRRQKLFVPH